jgi:hypothetical protein
MPSRPRPTIDTPAAAGTRRSAIMPRPHTETGAVNHEGAGTWRGGGCAVLALAAAALLSAGAAQARSTYDGVTAVVAQRASGGSWARADEPAAVEGLMREINGERSRSWVPYRGKPGECAVRLSFYAGERRVGRLLLDGNDLIESTGVSDTTGVVREIARTDLKAVRRLAFKVQGSGCDR